MNGFETIQDISTYCQQSRDFFIYLFIFKGQFTEEKKTLKNLVSILYVRA